jgi:hypothetical protein
MEHGSQSIYSIGIVVNTLWQFVKIVIPSEQLGGILLEYSLEAMPMVQVLVLVTINYKDHFEFGPGVSELLDRLQTLSEIIWILFKR